MRGQLILGMVLLAPMFFQAPDPNRAPRPKSGEQVEQQVNEAAIEKQIEQSINEDAIEKQVEEHIDRIMGQVQPSDWTLHGLVALLIPIAFFALLALMGWLLYRTGQTRAQARADFYKQLLDRFASGGEFAQFLSTEGGKRFLEGPWSQHLNAKERILRSMRGGVVITVVGLAALGLSWRQHGLLVPGGLILALGVGFLISTGISYRLSRKMGCLRDDAQGPGSEMPSQT